MTFFFTAIFIVMVMWRPQEWLVPWLSGWPVLDVVVVFSLFAFLIEHNEGRIKIQRSNPQIWLLFWLWIAAIMSHAANTYFAGMMATIPEAFKICFYTALLITVVNSVEKIRTVALLLVLMTCFMAWHGLLQQSRGYGFGGLRPMFDAKFLAEDIEGNPWRSLFYGIFGDPNDFAQILATSIPLVFIIPRRMNILWFAVCCAVVYLVVQGILATQSRGGMIALAAVAGVMAILMLPSRMLPYGMALGVIGGLLACPLAGPLLDSSARERIVYWGMGNEVFKSHPIFGIGSAMFWQVAGSRAAHNAYVSCYVELGLFGYIFWFGLLYLGMVGAWRTRMLLGGVRGSKERWFKRSIGLLIASTTGFAASSYFLSRTFLYPFFFLFALMAAVPVIAKQYLPEGAPPILKRKDVFIKMPLAALASVVYIYFSIVLLNRAYGG